MSLYRSRLLVRKASLLALALGFATTAEGRVTPRAPPAAPGLGADARPTREVAGSFSGDAARSATRKKVAETPASLTQVPREAPADAWWTGPMLAASAETLPRGHILIEPYVFDVRTGQSDHLGTLTYFLYGAANRLSVGMISTTGLVLARSGRKGAPGVGDTTLLAQYRLTRFGEHGWPVTLTAVVQEGVPTGLFDRLDRHRNGLGSGAYSTQLALYAQSLTWLPNGRILRLRLDVGHTLPSIAHPRDESVYGTPAGFIGRVRRGSADVVDGSLEYSLTREIALAAEAEWQHSAAGRVRGTAPAGKLNDPFDLRLRGSDSFYFAPAVEYSWTSNIGLLFAVRLSPTSRNSPSSVTPAIALNWVL